MLTMFKKQKFLYQICLRNPYRQATGFQKNKPKSTVVRALVLIRTTLSALRFHGTTELPPSVKSFFFFSLKEKKKSFLLKYYITSFNQIFH